MKAERKKPSIKDVHSAMREKYFHSKGARLLLDGDFEGANVNFQTALKIREQSFTRYHCGLACIKGNHLGEAISEMSRAIEINPDVPEYYLERGSIFRTIGEPLCAEKDVRKACELDENFRRIDVIKERLATVRDSLSGLSFLDELGKKRVKSRRIRTILNNLRSERDERRDVLENSSCSLPCPSYCCHFSDETIVHGLCIGPWKLHAIREFLRKQGLSEDTYLGRLSYDGEQYLKELIPPQFIVSEKGEKWIYYPLRQKKKLPMTLLENLPKGNDYQTLVWINEKARACVFLQNGRCMIHDTGGEDGLPSCKEFLCLTGFAFAVMKSLDIIRDEEIAHREMEGLNRIAVESMLVLAEEMFGSKSVINNRLKMKECIEMAIDADRLGNDIEVTRHLEEFEKAKTNDDGAISGLKRKLRATLANLIEGQ